MANAVANIKGVVSVSMLDWEGKLVSTLFMGGCNLRCCFCQNPDLIDSPNALSDVAWKKIKRHLQDKKDWLDGCVISGGEPCIYPGLKSLLFQIKSLGYPIKLDTNGTLPKVLSQIIKEELVDYVAMDLKTSFEKYPSIARTPLDLENIKKSVELIAGAANENLIEAEFRTTVVPEYVCEEDLLEIAGYLAAVGAGCYYLQQFDPKHVLEPGIGTIRPYSEEHLAYLTGECDKIVPTTCRSLLN